MQTDFIYWGKIQKSLPYLRHSLATKELEIKGIQPPTLSSVTTGVQTSSMTIQQQQQQQSSSINRVTTMPTAQGNQQQHNRPGATGTLIQRGPSAGLVNASTSSVPRATKVQAGKTTAAPKTTKTQQQQQQQQQQSKMGPGTFIKQENVPATASQQADSSQPPISFTITLPQSATTSVSQSGAGATPSLAAASAGRPLLSTPSLTTTP